MVNVKTQSCRCMRCSHMWRKRKSAIDICPRCKSPYWNIPKGVLSKGRPSEVGNAV